MRHACPRPVSCPRPVLPARCLVSAGLLVLIGCLASVGCSGGGAAASKVEAAKATVASFLDAIKRGDDAAASGLLTEQARAKTREMGISVAPPGADSAVCAITGCEMVSESDDLAHVGTTLTETDADGFQTTQNVVWVVRLDPQGWRVVGMAVKVFDDMAPLLLNFEDPEDMLAKQEHVAEELRKRAEGGPKTPAAAQPRDNQPQTARGGNQQPATVR